MKDTDCIAFLQWALPRLGLRWAGYRKVRAQVCKRVARRRRALGLGGIGTYRDYLAAHPAEWTELEQLCPVTISRFYRDRDVFDFIAATLLPALAAAADRDQAVRALSLGCASGEEPYTLRLAWEFAVAPAQPRAALRIVATDVIGEVLARARAACYPAGSLRLLPPAWRAAAFECAGRECCLRPRFRRGVDFRRTDVRTELPAGPFDLILCRNLVFTYFDAPSQRAALRRMLEQLRPGGALVLGRGERLPGDGGSLAPWPGAAERLKVFRYGG